MKALVISAYPACGKSTIYNEWSIYSGNENGLKILDSDSSLFSWVYDENGNKTNIRNTDFPNNYIKYIKEHLKTEDIIFVSSHKVVREALYEAHIPYISIFPKDTLLNMKDWKLRFLDRGNTQSFIDFQMEHWTEFIKDLEADITPISKIRLDVNECSFAITKDMIKHLLRRWRKLYNSKDK